MQIAYTVQVDLGHQEKIDAVTAALAEQGFGMLTSIDIKATLKAKLDEDVDDYTILGACNPRLAHAALSASPEVGLLATSPCDGPRVERSFRPSIQGHPSRWPSGTAPTSPTLQPMPA